MLTFTLEFFRKELRNFAIKDTSFLVNSINGAIVIDVAHYFVILAK